MLTDILWILFLVVITGIMVFKRKKKRERYLSDKKEVEIAFEREKSRKGVPPMGGGDGF
ncbi:hypothetical protein ERJ70_16445 [Sediminibacillus dalangtanensis]|uniref:LPXTG-motif cell wall anchor domain-containing protein n=1 Tax=Sediminibacillus dalangtanensis TaxID=2729421 RepID=A0ABX7VUU9_9BACI|nr:hypothetical protein [Sediminibacillus dalangtanensis]QTN00732.1 hypothetical protein ERJ70_16445 [Sediminibacillus dalangtanensis]